MLVRKEEIINILSESKLASGEYVNNFGETCAVGAIIRGLIDFPYAAIDINVLSEEHAPRGMAPSAKPYIESGDYLSALSIHFENIMFAYDDVYTEEVREEILNFVNKYFPNEIVVNV